MPEYLSIILSAVGVVITGLATWLSTYLINLLNQKIKDQNLKKVLSELSTLVTDSVKSTYQTFVDELKKTDQWTGETKKEALTRALNSVLTQLSTDTKTFLQNNFTDLEQYIINLIESKLYDLKQKPISNC